MKYSHIVFGAVFGLIMAICGLHITEWKWWALIVPAALYGEIQRQFGVRQ